jgi:hypothetical protein
MFKDEAKIAVQLNHANIAQIFDLDHVDGAYFIALEHVHGRDLRSIFERCRMAGVTMPVAQACFIVMKMCEGLDYAHNKRDAQGRDMNLVHRDVSPQNVLVSFEGEIKIIDFGIAKAAGKVGKTQQGILKGKFGYMSPEQVRGLPIDRRSDIFSAGIVLYELLTSERLFVGESDFSTLEKVRNVEILPPSTYNRKIPDELERIVLKALAKDVDDRYANAIDLHDELQAFVYTAGEFYSRKDLAAWMKRTFAKEIQEETAKIEEYRQVPSRVLRVQPDRTVDDGDTMADRQPPIAEPELTPAARGHPGPAPVPTPPLRSPHQVRRAHHLDALGGTAAGGPADAAVQRPQPPDDRPAAGAGRRARRPGADHPGTRGAAAGAGRAGAVADQEVRPRVGRRGARDPDLRLGARAAAGPHRASPCRGARPDTAAAPFHRAAGLRQRADRGGAGAPRRRAVPARRRVLVSPTPSPSRRPCRRQRPP